MVVPKYLNCSTFSKHLLPIFMSWLCPAFWWWDSNIYLQLVFSVFTSFTALKMYRVQIPSNMNCSVYSRRVWCVCVVNILWQGARSAGLTPDTVKCSRTHRKRNSWSGERGSLRERKMWSTKTHHCYTVGHSYSSLKGTLSLVQYSLNRLHMCHWFTWRRAHPSVFTAWNCFKHLSRCCSTDPPYHVPRDTITYVLCNTNFCEMFQSVATFLAAVGRYRGLSSQSAMLLVSLT
jgi:hypothetical protein